ncbi:GtrA-like protein [compost metagenome]
MAQATTPGLTRFIRFLGVGACATGAQYLVLWAGVSFYGMRASLASGAGYVLGALINYLLNYFYTFGSNRSHTSALPRFYATALIGWCLNTGLMLLLADTLGLNKWLAQALATGLCLAWNFTAAKLWVYAPAR